MTSSDHQNLSNFGTSSLRKTTYMAIKPEISAIKLLDRGGRNIVLTTMNIDTLGNSQSDAVLQLDPSVTSLGLDGLEIRGYTLESPTTHHLIGQSSYKNLDLLLKKNKTSLAVNLPRTPDAQP